MAVPPASSRTPKMPILGSGYWSGFPHCRFPSGMGAIALMVAFMSSSVSGSEVVVIGASITEQWHIEQLPGRAPGVSRQLSSLIRYAFDKRPEIKSVIGRPKTPAALILKQCAAYFPGDLAKYKSLIEGWTKELRQAGIEPVLAT